MTINNAAIVYHKDYNKYDLGLDHPLIKDKPQRTMEFFEKKGLLKKFKIFTPKKATEKDILKVHNIEYLEKVKLLSKTGGMLSFDTPAPVGIYDIALLVTGGTKLAGNLLFNGFQYTVNPLAGFHHASRNFSSGFCFFNDIAVVIESLREKYNLERFLIIDLDVHHANGTQEIYYDDPSVLKISFHQDGRTLYPGTGSIEKIGRDDGEGYTINLPLPPGTGNVSYLKAFNAIVPPLVKQFNPEIIIYQCGVDTHHSDPLADLNLSFQIYYHLARKTKLLSESTCDKLLVLFGGGYNSEASVISYYNIMCGLIDSNNYIKEEATKDNNTEVVEHIIEELKDRLSAFWNL